MQRRNVVLPEPDGPMISTTSRAVHVKRYALEHLEGSERFARRRVASTMTVVGHIVVDARDVEQVVADLDHLAGTAERGRSAAWSNRTGAR